MISKLLALCAILLPLAGYISRLAMLVASGATANMLAVAGGVSLAELMFYGVIALLPTAILVTFSSPSWLSMRQALDRSERIEQLTKRAHEHVPTPDSTEEYEQLVRDAGQLSAEIEAAKKSASRVPMWVWKAIGWASWGLVGASLLFVPAFPVALGGLVNAGILAVFARWAGKDPKTRWRLINAVPALLLLSFFGAVTTGIAGLPSPAPMRYTFESTAGLPADGLYIPVGNADGTLYLFACGQGGSSSFVGVQDGSVVAVRPAPRKSVAGPSLVEILFAGKRMRNDLC
jgi:hypothetical protein